MMQHNENNKRLGRKTRMAVMGILVIAALSLALPLVGYGLHALTGEAIAQERGGDSNPRANYWSAVRQGVEGYSAVSGPESGVLMQSGGTNWMQTRTGPVAKFVPWAIPGMFALIALFHLIAGRNKLDKPRSGKVIHRWSFYSRAIHWVTAISFIALAVTGLSMLVGRELLIPLLGKAGFAGWASVAIQIHNVVGPVFSIGIVLMIISWIWYNFPNAVDMKWFAQGGGLVGKGHPSAGRMNGGEKVWFWLVTIAGLVVCYTGLVMVAPAYGFVLPDWMQGWPLVEGLRTDMRQATLIHAVAAVLWSAVALGHIYIGTLGTEGAYEGMKTGYVSAEWAEQHHDLWYEDQLEKGNVMVRGEAGEVNTSDQVVSGNGSAPAA